ncbi:hypothetical protein [Spiroplasma tabanidicola]|uniref:ABC transporter permease n=1 Tax=Spiroplasma tabanidicola TaxID=324079 RepID=A0A6I6CI89_9MOLU|nr:hypothetical protein [Spiroplasma tabanidicola]QGS51773.1 hypothetical protein STABA_v1c04100 [Spiroplasma tabanidicola]
MMKFYICFKYALFSIFKSKSTLIVTIFFLSTIFLINLIFGLYIKLTQAESVDLFVLNYINTVLIFIFLSVVSILLSNEFFTIKRKMV